ncbi:hypothetical protein DTO003C3_10355 [Penicillium roqueforti]|nr:hypothetical protein DTO003C3_10355 [Penicillium roqueforti]
MIQLNLQGRNCASLKSSKCIWCDPQGSHTRGLGGFAAGKSTAGKATAPRQAQGFLSVEVELQACGLPKDDVAPVDVEIHPPQRRTAQDDDVPLLFYKHG